MKAEVPIGGIPVGSLDRGFPFRNGVIVLRPGETVRLKIVIVYIHPQDGLGHIGLAMNAVFAIEQISDLALQLRSFLFGLLQPIR